jgi:hypothetical protein
MSIFGTRLSLIFNISKHKVDKEASQINFTLEKIDFKTSIEYATKQQQALHYTGKME